MLAQPESSEGVGDRDAVGDRGGAAPLPSPSRAATKKTVAGRASHVLAEPKWLRMGRDADEDVDVDVVGAGVDVLVAVILGE